LSLAGQFVPYLFAAIAWSLPRGRLIAPAVFMKQILANGEL